MPDLKDIYLLNIVLPVKVTAFFNCRFQLRAISLRQLDVLLKVQLRGVLSVLIKAYNSLFRMCNLTSMS